MRLKIILAGIVALVGLAIGVGLSFNLKTPRYVKPLPQNSQTYKPVSACDVFSLANAQKLVGPGASSAVNAPPSDTDDLRVSSCAYNLSGNTPAELKSASLTLRSPKSEAGATNNQDEFKKLSSSAQIVSTLGDQAYWDTSTGELNILKHGNWLVIVDGSSLQPTERKMDQPKALARAILPKIP